MLRRLAFNTGISTVTYFLVSVIGLVVVPVLINEYGLTLFGLIILARLFLPTAGLAFIDVGFGEVAILSVAQARSTGEWGEASRYISMLTLAALAMGVIAGALLAISSGALTRWFGVTGASSGEFQSVLIATALSLPLLFAGLVAEGILKGYERFGYQRTCELLGAVSYAAGVAYCVTFDRPFSWVCYTQLASQILRLAVVLVGLAASEAPTEIRPIWGSRLHAAFLYERCRLVFAGKMLGSVQTQAPPLLIGVLLTPAAVALYDVLGRLPRFAKAVLGLISGTLLPSAIRLSAAGDASSHQRLSEGGLLAILVLLVPCLSAGMFYSEPILRLWIGPSVSAYWWWQGLMFVIPVLTVITTYGATFVFDQPRLLVQMTRLAGIQVAIQFLVSLALLPWLQERAFILGQVIAAIAVFAPQLRVVLSIQPDAKELAKTLIRAMALLSAVPVAMAVIGSSWVLTLPMLAVSGVIFSIIYAAFTWAIVLHHQQRSLVRMAVRRVGRRRA